MKINLPEFEFENGDPSISYRNIVRAIQYYGSPVGIIQAILPENEGQATQVFFFDGWAHLALGFSIGFNDAESEERFTRVMALQQVMKLVPGWAHDEEHLFELGLDIKENKKTVKFILIPTKNNLLEMIEKSPGMKALNNCVEIETANGEIYK